MDGVGLGLGLGLGRIGIRIRISSPSPCPIRWRSWSVGALANCVRLPCRPFTRGRGDRATVGASGEGWAAITAAAGVARTMLKVGPTEVRRAKAMTMRCGSMLAKAGAAVLFCGALLTAAPAQARPRWHVHAEVD